MRDHFDAEGILRLTRELVSIPSVTGSGRENDAAAFIHDFFRETAYFRDHPECLMIFPVEKTGQKRLAVLAFLRAGCDTEATILLNGHFDVVDTDVCGDLSGCAFLADEYTRRLTDRRLPEDADGDLRSGNWLFGRGVMDMKCGLAMHMAYMEHMASMRNEMRSNLLFLAVPDEEGDSAGMRGALPVLSSFIARHSLDVRAALSGEPAFWGAGSAQGVGERIFFTGTTGKIMPMFFCIGREAHAGFCFDGLNAAAIAAEVVSLMEGSPAFLDGVGNEVMPPPVCLKMKDLRDTYSVTLPEKAVAYFNVLTVTHSPRDVLEMCRDIAAQALDAVIRRQKLNARAYAERAGGGIRIREWNGRVLDVEAVVRMTDHCRDEREKFIDGLPEEMDAREKGIAIVNRMAELANIKGPAVITGFLPPYYPHRINRRETDKERRLRAVMERLCAQAESAAGNVKLVECFTGIMDLSYMGFQGSRDELLALAENMPGWGRIFSLPMDDLLSLDVPIASIGPAGKDAHKDTERLELGFSLHTAPAMLERAVEMLSLPDRKEHGIGSCVAVSMRQS